jgi:two-component system, OmpR family, phosphate regulon response regulator PhoB
MKSILIAEGDGHVARLFATVFSRNNWMVRSLDDATKAAEVLSGNEPFDVVVVSYKIKGMSGVELTKLIRSLAHRRDTPVVMVTGRPGIEPEALGAGADEVLSKPIDIYTLLESVSGYAARARHEDSSR